LRVPNFVIPALYQQVRDGNDNVAVMNFLVSQQEKISKVL